MVQEFEKEIILECARRYNVSSVVLFGSSTNKDVKYNDIDIAVKGLNPHLFFKFYAELFRRLPKPIDLVDLSKKSAFNSLIEENGVKIYG